MTEDQAALIAKAEESLTAAQLLLTHELPSIAVSRAYYSMFYVAKAFLAGQGLSFSSHKATIAAFGQHITRGGLAPVELHRFLIDAQEVRLIGDYLAQTTLTAKDAELQIERAERFLAVARGKLSG